MKNQENEILELEKKLKEDGVFRGVDGSRLIRPLFFELCLADKSKCLYTLKHRPHQGLPSLYHLFMACDDPTEYKFANKYFEDWDHWLQVRGNSTVKEHVEQWQKELEVKIKADALVRIRSEAKAGKINSFQCNKYLLEKHWVDKESVKGSVGRPSKDEIKRQAEVLFESKIKADDDWNRIKGIN